MARDVVCLKRLYMMEKCPRPKEVGSGCGRSMLPQPFVQQPERHHARERRVKETSEPMPLEAEDIQGAHNAKRE
ncbi:MAG: hypothetical protein Q9226_003711 [Calogaya cf. arnoldii]